MTDAGPTILCIGHDPLLNRTRRLILQQRFDVKLACTVAEATALLASERCDLVLLCYSLTEEECEAMVEFIHKLPAKTRILALAHGRRENLLLGPQDEEFVSGGPAELLSKASSIAGLPALDETGETSSFIGRKRTPERD